MSPRSREMKFWELISAFRGCSDVVRAVLCSPEWFDPWGAALERYDDIVRRQDRDTLDAAVPIDLSRAVARLDRRTWSLDHSGHLRLAHTDTNDGRLLSTLEVHDRFGGWVLEEVLEFGSLQVVGGVAR
jgi:hypothetical protein